MTDHIVINVETGQYECQHCGATQSPPKMPVLIRDMLAHIDMFTAAHKDCKAALAQPPLPVQPEQAQQGMLPDCWVVIKDGQIIGTHDEPGTLNGVAAIRYVPALPVQEPVAENEAPPPSEYEQGFAAGVGFILHAFEQQMSLPPYDQHTDILERLLDYLKH